MHSSVARLIPLERYTPAPDTHATEWPILICLLGPFRLLKLGHPIAVGGGGKTEALLTHLALHPGRPASRSELLHLLWPDQDAALAGQSLNSLVYALRKRLSDALGGAPPSSTPRARTGSMPKRVSGPTSPSSIAWSSRATSRPARGN